MKKNLLKKIWLGLGFLFTFYLFLPGPKLPPPDLPDSLKSTLPGDTIQLPRISGYFTDKNRSDVIDFYKNYFSKSSFLNFPLLTIRLNHPPEHAKQVIRDTTRSYYLEELVHPFRESLFINGFEWEKDVFTSPEKRAKNKILTGDRVRRAKIILRWFPSKLLFRLVIFWSCWIAFWVIVKEWKREIRGQT